ncbi:MAG: HAD-IA family hydrolase [Lachnospiraceae bacterium]|nr:HAD-IA family hydrolase [Lachnospiraceae bacterium]
MKAVIFDLDDTLYPEIEYVFSGYRKVAKVLSERHIDSIDNLYDRMVQLFRDDSKMVFNRLLDVYGIKYEKADVIELIDIYRNHLPEIHYHEDAMSAIDLIREKGIKTGILTDGYAVTQRQKLKALKADDIFDVIVVTDELGREAWKPSKVGFEKAAEELDCTLKDMIYVGDNPNKDFYVSRTAGVKTARITRDNGVYTDAPYFEGVREDYRLETLSDIVKYLGD